MSEGVSVFSSVTALWSTLFGVGMYFTPRAFAKSGILYACLQLLGVGGITFISILVLFILSIEAIYQKPQTKNEEKDIPLATCSLSIQEKDLKTEVNYVQEKQVKIINPDDGIRLSYAGLGKSLKKWLGVTVDVMIMMAAFSTVLFIQKFISLTSTNLLGQSVVNSIGFDPYYIFVLFYGLIIWLGGQFKDLQSIDWLSKISFASIAINCLIVGALNFILGDFKSTHVSNPNKNVSLSVISTFIFAMFCQNNVVEIFNNMNDKNVKYLIIVAAAAPLGACVFYAIMGIAGSLLFGDYMPTEDIISIFANENSAIVKHLYDTNSKFYCIHFIVPCVAIIGLLISSIYQLSSVTRSLNEKKIFKKIQSKTKKQAVTTFIVICLITFINMFPQIGLSLVFDLIGQFMCNPLAFAFPFLFMLIKSHKNKDYGIKFFGSLIFIIGSVSFAFAGFIYPRILPDLSVKNSFNMTTTSVPNITSLI